MARKKYKADGKVSDMNKTISKQQEIDNILQMNGSNPFGVSSEEDLKDKISEMTMIDLQNLAMKANVFPSGSRSTLKNKILKAHKARKQGKGVARSVINSQPTISPNSKNAKRALEIINS